MNTIRTKRPRKIIGITSIVMSIVGLLLVFISGDFVYQDMAGFRPCSVNNTGLSVVSCGKSSLTPGDMVAIVIFVASVTMAFTFLFSSYKYIFYRRK